METNYTLLESLKPKLSNGVLYVALRVVYKIVETFEGKDLPAKNFFEQCMRRALFWMICNLLVFVREMFGDCFGYQVCDVDDVWTYPVTDRPILGR